MTYSAQQQRCTTYEGRFFATHASTGTCLRILKEHGCESAKACKVGGWDEKGRPNDLEKEVILERLVWFLCKVWLPGAPIRVQHIETG